MHSSYRFTTGLCLLLYIVVAQADYSESGGEVTLEAEDYHAINAGTTNDAWTPDCTTGIFSGDSAMFVGPDDGDVITGPGEGTPGDPVNDSPRLSYNINFTTDGTYTLWLKGLRTNAAGDSVHVGFDNTFSGTISFSNTPDFAWTTNNVAPGGATPITFLVSGAPVNHTFDLWMREDGVFVDKILLTTNVAADPATMEPTADVPTAGGGALPTAAQPVMNPNGGFFDPTVDVTLSTCTSGANVHFTQADPSTPPLDPTSGDPIFATPITLSVDTLLKARAIKAGTHAASSVASATFINNQAPVANDDSGTANETVDEGATKTVDLAANDTDGDDGLDLTSINIVSGPTNGNVVDNNDGTVDYIHDDSETTSDSFTYTIDDTRGETSNVATVTMTINPVNDGPPVAVDDPNAGTTPEGTLVTTVNVLGNDTLVDNAVISAFDATSANGGTVADNGDGTFDYTPPAGGFNGSDTFTYTLTDDDAESDTATVTVTVTSVNNGTPDAVDDPNAGTTPEGTLVTTVNVLSNDTLVDNAVISAFDATSANGGTVADNGDGTFDYTPAAGFNGTDTFTYTLSDDEGDTDTATVTVTVTSVNNGTPDAVDDPNAGTTPEDTLVTTVNVLTNDTLVDNAVISAFDATSANGGTVTDNGDGTFDYTPAAGFNGTDTFTYTLSDDEGDTDTATVTVTVTSVNSGTPDAVDDPNAGTTPEDTLVTTVNVLTNDTLVDNAVISAFDATSANGGTVTDNGDGTFDYTPAAGFNGTDTFTYTLSDDEGDMDTATVTVTVTSVNNGTPDAVDDPNAGTTPEQVLLTTANVLANDTLVDNAVISAFDATSANGGTVADNGDGTFDYTPPAGFTGMDTFTYTLSDDEGDMDTATVTVTVTTLTDRDFNGDAMSDILWRNEGTGSNAIWFMDEATVLPASDFTSPLADLNWQVAGRGDFNGDGKSDILWRHAVTGQNVIWFMDGVVLLAGSGSTVGLTDLNWHVAGAGDFNGDGKTDILWRHAVTGQNVIWFMDGTALLAGSGATTGLVDLDWQVGGTGDFNGDDKTDILWRHAVTGQNVIWFMDGTALLAGSGTTTGLVDLNWQVAGTGDFNGDGMSDILWRHAVTGQNVIWFMDGTSLLPGSGLTTPLPVSGWQVVGTGDYNGDGKFDILWRHGVNGNNAIWFMDGTTVLPASAQIIALTDLNWKAH